MRKPKVNGSVNRLIDRRVIAIAARAAREAEIRRGRTTANDRVVEELPVWSSSTFGGSTLGIYEELMRRAG